MSDDNRHVEQAKIILRLLGENARLRQAISVAPHDWRFCEIGDTDIDGGDDGKCHCWKLDTKVEDASPA